MVKMLNNWRPLTDNEKSCQTDGAGPFCINCLYKQRRVLADWMCQDGCNGRFWCHNCAFMNMLFWSADMPDRLIALLISQDDARFQMLGDALTRKDVREVLPSAPQLPTKMGGKRRPRKTTSMGGETK
jgi:hypothetical protein